MAVAREPRNRALMESITLLVWRPGRTSVVTMPMPTIPSATFSAVLMIGLPLVEPTECGLRRGRDFRVHAHEHRGDQREVRKVHGGLAHGPLGAGEQDRRYGGAERDLPVHGL